MGDLNLKHFKKMSGDKNSTTLKHANGHELKIAHASLSPKMKKELDGIPMCEGGMTRNYAEGDTVDAAPNTPGGFDVSAMGAPQDSGGPAPASVSAPMTDPGTVQDQGAPSAGAGLQADQPPQDINKWVQDHTNDMLDQSQKSRADIDSGHITPKTYGDLFADKSTLGKIGTIFGMLVGGAGSGLTHQPMLLMQMMDKQIQNDLEAQKTSAANKQNFLRIHMAQELNPALINKAVQDGRLSKAQADLANYQNKIWGVGKAANDMRNAAGNAITTTANNLPPNSPNKAPAVAAASAVNAGIQTENAAQAQKTAQQAAQHGAITGFWKQPGESLNDWVQRSMGEPSAPAADDNNLPIPPPISNKIVPDGAEKALMMASVPGTPYSSFAQDAKTDITKGRQAETFLDNSDNYFNNMEDAVKRGGKTAFAARNMSPQLFAGLLSAAGEYAGGVPGAIVGGVGGAGLGEAGKIWGKLNQANREYFANAANVQGELAALYPNSTAEERASMLQKSMPELGDTPRTAAVLRNSFKNQVRVKAQPNNLNLLMSMMKRNGQ